MDTCGMLLLTRIWFCELGKGFRFEFVTIKSSFHMEVSGCDIGEIFDSIKSFTAGLCIGLLSSSSAELVLPSLWESGLRLEILCFSKDGDNKLWSRWKIEIITNSPTTPTIFSSVWAPVKKSCHCRSQPIWLRYKVLDELKRPPYLVSQFSIWGSNCCVSLLSLAIRHECRVRILNSPQPV